MCTFVSCRFSRRVNKSDLLDMEFLASFLRNWEAHIQIKISFDQREPEGLGVGVQNLRGETPHKCSSLNVVNVVVVFMM